MCIPQLYNYLYSLKQYFSTGPCRLFGRSWHCLKNSKPFNILNPWVLSSSNTSPVIMIKCIPIPHVQSLILDHSKCPELRDILERKPVLLVSQKNIFVTCQLLSNSRLQTMNSAFAVHHCHLTDSALRLRTRIVWLMGLPCGLKSNLLPFLLFPPRWLILAPLNDYSTSISIPSFLKKCSFPTD